MPAQRLAGLEPTPPFAPGAAAARTLPLHRRQGRILEAFPDPSAFDPTRGGANRTPAGICARRLEVDERDARGRCEFVSLEPGLHLLILDLELPQGFASPLVGEDLVEFHFRLSGAMALAGPWGEIVMDRPALLIWHQPLGHREAWEELRPGPAARELSVTLYAARSWLSGLFEADGAPPAPFGDILAGAAAPAHRLLQPAAETVALLHAILADCEDSARRLVRLKARAFQVLADALALAAGDGAENGPSPAPDAVARARAILEVEFAAPPTPRALGARVGLSPGKLRRAFRGRYGVTMQAFLQDRRLRHAYDLLSAGELQVGQVAEAAGYAHHSTFTAAFLRRFAMLPKTVARSAAAPKT